MAEDITYNETELLTLIANGHEGAFRVVYDRYRGRVFSIACNILKEAHQAEDAVQDVFTTIWLHRSQLPNINNFDAYLNTITRNYLFNQLKKMAHAARYVKQQAHSSVISNPVMDSVEFNDLNCRLAQVVDQLSPQQKKVYRLGKEEGLRYEEIALELQVSKETVKTHMSGALRTIKAGLLKQQQVINKLMLLAGSIGFLIY